MRKKKSTSRFRKDSDMTKIDICSSPSTISTQMYHCMECGSFDMCQSCFTRGTSTPVHRSSTHPHSLTQCDPNVIYSQYPRNNKMRGGEEYGRDAKRSVEERKEVLTSPFLYFLFDLIPRSTGNGTATYAGRTTNRRCTTAFHAKTSTCVPLVSPSFVSFFRLSLLFSSFSLSL